MTDTFYVYHYLREDGSPYYVGKGIGNRCYDKRHGVNIPPDRSKIILVKTNLTEQEAFQLEKSEILKFGRKDNQTGILRNKTNGGEGASGSIKTANQKQIIGDFHRGKTLSEETRKKVGLSSLGRKHPPRTKEFKDNLSKINTGKIMSEEAKNKISKARSGKTLSEEHRRKISQSRKKYNEVVTHL